MNPTFLKKYQLALVSTAFTLLLAVPGTLLSSQSPRMIRIQGMVEAFNTGEPQALLSFLESNATPDWTASRPAEGRLKLFEQLMHELG